MYAQENSKNIQVDVWRFKQVCQTVSLPGHPYRKFGTGTTIKSCGLPVCSCVLEVTN